MVRYFMFSRALLVAWLCAVFTGGSIADSVYVKYRDSVPLGTFHCANTEAKGREISLRASAFGAALYVIRMVL